MILAYNEFLAQKSGVILSPSEAVKAMGFFISDIVDNKTGIMMMLVTPEKFIRTDNLPKSIKKIESPTLESIMAKK